ncbi:MAG: biliverdin-producing heme oxygenase [Polymorphobacter sp.]
MREQAETSLRDGAVTRLRTATQPSHAVVDAAFSVFDLADRRHYGRFLQAHARATGAAEACLIDVPTLPPWRSRLPQLTADLEGLGLGVPEALAFTPAEGDAWHWGVLYVLEGSRLGSALVVKRAGSNVPTAYLSSRHLAGEWRSLLMAIEARGDAGGAAWTDAAIAGARDCFALYQRAAMDMTA